MTKLCINPECPRHCDVVLDEPLWGWRYANGYQCSLTNSELAYFDPESDTNLCQACEGVVSLLKALKLLPPQ